MQELGVRSVDTRTEEDFLRAMEVRLHALLSQEPERLARLLYRLDVNEHAADNAVASGANAPALLARLILERSRAKAASRANFSVQPDEDDPSLLL